MLEQLLKVHDQERNCNVAFGSIRELGHNATKTVASLGLTEFTLYGIAISFIFTLLLNQLWWTIGRSSTQRRTTEPNSSFFAPSSIGSGAINLVDMKRFGIVTESLVILLYSSPGFVFCCFGIRFMTILSLILPTNSWSNRFRKCTNIEASNGAWFVNPGNPRKYCR